MSDDATPAQDTILGCEHLEETLRLFTERLGFRLDAIAPADDPFVAAVSGHGLRVVLLREGACEPDEALRLVRAGGLVVPVPQPAFVVSRMDENAWKTGRAGMRYRDLIPGRMGGYMIASHIRIEEGGPVPDQVHYHDVRFQLIYCLKGWVRLVYEDQGPPFRLEAGDGVLQPPGIRHRVLASSPGLEVIEVACPATHTTFIDHEMTLPTPDRRPDRDFGGQRYARLQAGGSTGRPLLEMGPVRAFVREREGPQDANAHLFAFVLSGTARVGEQAEETVRPGDAFVIPAGSRRGPRDPSDDFKLLAVSVEDRRDAPAR